MQYSAASIESLIGAKDFITFRQFYIDLGFAEDKINDIINLFKVNERLSFYLQDYYVIEWIENSMLLLEVDNVFKCYSDIENRALSIEYKIQIERYSR